MKSRVDATRGHAVSGSSGRPSLPGRAAGGTWVSANSLLQREVITDTDLTVTAQAHIKAGANVFRITCASKYDGAQKVHAEPNCGAVLQIAETRFIGVAPYLPGVQ